MVTCPAGQLPGRSFQQIAVAAEGGDPAEVSTAGVITEIGSFSRAI
jgi:hypothetical protein